MPLPRVALDWRLDASGVAAAAAAAMARQSAALDAVGALSTAEESALSYASVIGPLETLERDAEPLVAAATFLKDVSSDAAVRAASAEAASALASFDIAAGMRLDVYTAVSRYAAAAAARGELAALPPERARLVSRLRRDAARRGLHLPAAARAAVELLHARIAARCIAFSKALAEEKTVLAFTAAQLRGLPADFVASLKPYVGEPLAANAAAAAAAAAASGEPLLELTLAYPHSVPALKLAAEPATRAAVELAFNSRGGPGNAALLVEIVTLRRHAAAVLGYASHRHYVLEERMAATPEKVDAFLEGLARDLRPARDADLDALRARAGGGGGAQQLSMADYRFLAEADLAARFAVDHDRLREHFPLAEVLPAMLRFYATLFRVRFERLGGGEHLWHAEAEEYAVLDAAAGGGDGELIGHFFLDLHPREGKYGHAAVFPLISGCEGAAGGRVLPSAACVCNFPRGEAAKLRHEETVTLLHEFGHVLHHIFSRTTLHRFASFRCETDFVEAPSQMLENFAWQPATLALLCSAASPIAAADARALQASKLAHAGLLNSRQCFLAMLDQRLHALPALPPPPALLEALTAARVAAEAGDAAAAAAAEAAAAAALDVSEVRLEPLLDELHGALLGIPRTPGTNMLASFAHLTGGYDAGYYSYLWSEVYAADIFESAFADADPLSGKSGARYRELVLARGGSVDAADFLREFLGREPSLQPFLASKGLLPRAAAAEAVPAASD